MQRHAFHLKVEYRAVIRFLYLTGKTGKEIHGELADVYGSSVPLMPMLTFPTIARPVNVA